MAWITLTEAFITGKLTGPELNALRTAALAPGQEPPMPEAIRLVVREVRGYVRGNQANILAPGDTIPDELEDAALAMIRYRALNRLPTKSLLTQPRVDENAAALELMKAVAAGRFGVVCPDMPSTEKPSDSRAPLITPRPRQFSRASGDGA